MATPATDKEVQALREELAAQKFRQKFEARFHCTPESKDGMFYMKEVIEHELKAEAARPAREAAEATHRKAQEAHKVEVLAEPRNMYIFYRDGHRIAAKSLVCACGSVIGWNSHFEEYLLQVDARKNGPSALNDIGNISGMRPHALLTCGKCKEAHTYDILRLPE